MVRDFNKNKKKSISQKIFTECFICIIMLSVRTHEKKIGHGPCLPRSCNLVSDVTHICIYTYDEKVVCTINYIVLPFGFLLRREQCI